MQREGRSYRNNIRCLSSVKQKAGETLLSHTVLMCISIWAFALQRVYKTRIEYYLKKARLDCHSVFLLKCSYLSFKPNN